MAEVECEEGEFDEIESRVGQGFFLRRLPFLMVIRGGGKTLQDALMLEQALLPYPCRTMSINSEAGSAKKG